MKKSYRAKGTFRTCYRKVTYTPDLSLTPKDIKALKMVQKQGIKINLFSTKLSKKKVLDKNNDWFCGKYWHHSVDGKMKCKCGKQTKPMKSYV